MADIIRVLLVDDIPETRENLRKLLAFETDIEVVGAATTGREAIEMAEQERPHVILMDINMPDMDGIHATEEINRILPGASVVMMSVQSEADYLRRAMLAGARDFLTKPISGDDLYQTIRRAFELSRTAPAVAAAAPGGKEQKKKSVGTAAGNVIAVYSPQGGAGVTTIATNMATAMMQEGTRVLLIDADLQFGDVGVFLNLQSNANIVDLASAVRDLDEAFLENVMAGHPSGLKVLLGPTSPEQAEKVNPTDVVEIVSVVRRFYDFVIVDLPTQLNDMTLGILDAADRIALVATPTLPSIKNTRVMLDVFDALNYPRDKIMFIMNRVSQENAGRAYIPIEAIEKNLKRSTTARIPLDDKTFLSAVNQGVSVIAKDTNKSPAKDLITLADQVRRTFGPLEEEEPSFDESPKTTSRLGSLFRR